MGNLEDRDGRLIMDPKKKLERWKEYVLDLFNDNRSVEHGIRHAETGPPITKEKVSRALKMAKTGKALDPDEISTEILKLLKDHRISILTDLFNIRVYNTRIYNTSILPSDWLRSTFVTILKKNKSVKCSDYRTISLMSHAIKIFLKIIHGRIYHRLEEQMSENQFGFQKGLGCDVRSASFNPEMQRC